MVGFALAAILVVTLPFAAILAVTAATTGRGGATPGPAFAISTASAQPVLPFQGFDASSKLFDFNGDGRLEIVAQNDNQYAYVFDSESGAILAQMTTTFPDSWGARSFNMPEAARYADGSAHIILQNSAAYITSFRFDAASSSDSSFTFVKEWERRLSDCNASPGSDSKPVFADLDVDGAYEIVAATEEQGLYALRADGQVMWKTCMGGGNAEPTVADINVDGFPDVIYGSDGGVVTALDGRNGNYLWTYNVLDHFALHSASMPVGVAVGQLDGRSGPDVVVGVRDSHDAVDFSNDHAMLLALDSKGQLLWAKQDPEGNPLTYTHAIIVDAQNDGQPEVYWGDWNTIGHSPPAKEEDSWKTTGPANFYRYDAAGNMVWRQSLDAFWSNNDLAIADIDGDGVQDVLANGPGPGGDGFWSLDSRTGAKQEFISTHPWQVAGSPIIADLAGTGMMQLVVEVGPGDPSVSGGGVLVYDTGKPYNAVWPHLPYFSGLSLTPAPAGSTFDSTFTLIHPSEQWQQVDVDSASTRPVAALSLSVDGDAWRPMAKSSWGAWTSEFNIATGASVAFLAMDAGGATSQSAAFTWMDGTMSLDSVASGSTPPVVEVPGEPDPGVERGVVPEAAPDSDPPVTVAPTSPSDPDSAPDVPAAPPAGGKGIPGIGAFAMLALLMAVAVARRNR